MTELLLRRAAMYDTDEVPAAYHLRHSGTGASGLAPLLVANRAKSIARGLPLLATVATDELDAVVDAGADVVLWLRPAEAHLDADALARWQALPSRVQVVAGDPIDAPGHTALRPFASALHIDAEHLDVEEITQRRQAVAVDQIYVTGVHRRDLADRCRALGVSLLGGQYLNDVNGCVTRVVAGDRLTLLQLMSSLQDPDVSPRTVTSLVEQSASVSFELLRWVNSAYVGLKHPVDQVGRAVGLLGPGRVRQVVSLLLTRDLSDRPSELSRTALQRARMCQEVGAVVGDGRSGFYIAGMFSMLDTLLEMPMEEVVRQLPLTDDVANALLRHEGVIGRVLHATELYERAEFDDPIVQTIDPSLLAAAYLDALVFADDVLGAIAAA